MSRYWTVFRVFFSSWALGLLFPMAAQSASPTQLVHALGSSVLGYRGGTPTADYPFVVGLGIWSTQQDKKQHPTEPEGICSGTVINQSCVLTAEHCGSDEEAVGIFLGQTMKDKAPYASVVQKRHLSKERGPKDLMIVKLDKALPPSYSLSSTASIPNRTRTLAKGMPVLGVGYGAAAANLDVATETYYPVGMGTKRTGQLEIASFDMDSSLITVVPGDNNNLAGPGDSGGPLLTFDLDGNPRVVGVTGTMNKRQLIWADKNGYVSTLKHEQWIQDTLAELGCLDYGFSIAEVIRKRFQPFNFVQEFNRFWTSKDNLRERAKLVNDVGEFVRLRQEYPQGNLYKSINITPVIDRDGSMLLRWEAFLVDDPKTVQGKKLQDALVQLHFGGHWTQPSGYIRIPEALAGPKELLTPPMLRVDFPTPITPE